MTRSKRNAVLVRALRAKWRRLQRTRPGEVELRHVRSHTECPGNELADALADRGKDASPKNAVGWQHEETTRYAKEWMRQWRRGHSPDGGEVSGEREGGQANAVVGDRCGVG